MKWLQLTKDYDTRKAGEVYEEQDAIADVMVKTGAAVVTDEPKAVKDAETQVDVKAIAADIVAGLRDELLVEAKAASKAKRPSIVVGADRELENPTDGFKSFGEFTCAVAKARQGAAADERLTRRLKANGASENVNADGGYAVPVEYAQNIFDDVQDDADLMQLCTLVPMSTNTMKLPAINYTTQGSFGAQALWEGEGTAPSNSKIALRQPQLTLNKLIALTPLTSELLEDGLGVEAVTSKLAAMSIKYKLREAILFGNGTGQPTGIVGHASTATVTRTTSNTVKSTDVINMQSALLTIGNNPVWLINKGTVEPQLLTMQDAGGRYLYFAPGSFAADPNKGRLLGKPVIPVPNCAALGSSGDIILADFKGYLLGYKTAGVQKAMSIHVYFNTDEVQFRWTMRVDGRPWRDTTLAAAKGSGTYGFAVTM